MGASGRQRGLPGIDERRLSLLWPQTDQAGKGEQTVSLDSERSTSLGQVDCSAGRRPGGGETRVLSTCWNTSLQRRVDRRQKRSRNRRRGPSLGADTDHAFPQAWRAFLPLAITRMVGALSKTACLANVDAAFYQTSRGLLLPFTVLLSLYFFPSTRFAPLTVAGIALVILGFAGGIFVDLQQALSMNWGILLGVWSSFTTAVETVVLKQYTAANDTHMLQLIYMSSLVAALTYSPLALLFEAGTWTADSAEKHSLFLSHALLSSIVALILSFATWLQVKATSPVTHTVVAASRGVLQSLLASIAFAEALPFHRVVGTGLILGGTALYTYSKSLDGAAAGGNFTTVAASGSATSSPKSNPSPRLGWDGSTGRSSVVRIDMGSPILRTPKLV